MKRAFWALAAVLPLAAQPKLLVNAQPDTRSAAAGLEPAFRSLVAAQPQPAWIGYSVPAVRMAGLGCDWVRDGGASAGVVHLEPPDHAVILFRVEANALNRIRTVSPDCEIDAGGLPMHWLTDVQPAQSIALLASLTSERERVGDAMIGAIAVHADPAADQALERFVASDQPQSLRLRAISSLGSARGRRGLSVLKGLAAGDPDQRIRERAISALGNSREPEALELLISIARTDSNPRLRSQAVSSLGRRPGARIIETLTAVIENDRDTQVRRRAVSALQSMPDGEGIPVLIRLARSGRDPEIRKQAMSSLGASRDPRALSFFEDVLKH